MSGPAGSPALWPSERAGRIGLELLRPAVRRLPGRARPGRPGSTSTRCAAPTSPTSSRTAGTRCSSSSRPAMSTPRPPRSTPACRPTSAPAPCGGRSTRLAAAVHCRADRSDAMTGRGPPAAGQLPVAAAGADGRARHVHHHRPGAAAGRARHHPVALPGPPPGHRVPGTAVAAGPGRAVRHLRGHPRRPDRHHGRQRRAAAMRPPRPAAVPAPGRCGPAGPGSRPGPSDRQPPPPGGYKIDLLPLLPECPGHRFPTVRCPRPA